MSSALGFSFLCIVSGFCIAVSPKINEELLFCIVRVCSRACDHVSVSG